MATGNISRTLNGDASLCNMKTKLYMDFRNIFQFTYTLSMTVSKFIRKHNLLPKRVTETMIFDLDHDKGKMFIISAIEDLR